MVIRVFRSDCEHIEPESYYNNNYYKLPFQVNGLDVLYEEYDVAEEFCGNSIGIFIDGKFVPTYYLHTADHSDYFLIDSNTLGLENKWT